MDEKFLNVLYSEAIKSYRNNDIPVSAIIVKDGKIISKSHNNKYSKKNVVGHAEVNVIKKVVKKYGMNLSDFELYCTLKPCKMCEGLINEVKIKNVYYIVDKLAYKKEFNSNIKQTNVREDVQEKYRILLSNFFEKLR